MFTTSSQNLRICYLTWQSKKDISDVIKVMGLEEIFLDYTDQLNLISHAIFKKEELSQLLLAQERCSMRRTWHPIAGYKDGRRTPLAKECGSLQSWEWPSAYSHNENTDLAPTTIKSWDWIINPNFFLEPSERNLDCQHLDFSPVKLTLDFWSIEL